VARGYSQQPTHGADFCSDCGEPAPWLSREKLIVWLQVLVQADASIPTARRHELLQDLTALGWRARDDDKTVAMWEKLREKAPKAWERMRGPILDALMSEGVQRLVGLL
jgi:hypothetical protein